LAPLGRRWCAAYNAGLGGKPYDRAWNNYFAWLTGAKKSGFLLRRADPPMMRADELLRLSLTEIGQAGALLHRR
jgi:hypothetical protein